MWFSLHHVRSLLALCHHLSDQTCLHNPLLQEEKSAHQNNPSLCSPVFPKIPLISQHNNWSILHTGFQWSHSSQAIGKDLCANSCAIIEWSQGSSNQEPLVFLLTKPACSLTSDGLQREWDEWVTHNMPSWNHKHPQLLTMWVWCCLVVPSTLQVPSKTLCPLRCWSSHSPRLTPKYDHRPNLASIWHFY